MSKREHEQGEEQKERKKQTPHWAGTMMQGSSLGPGDHDLSQRQTFNHSHPGTPKEGSINKYFSAGELGKGQK